MDKKKYVIDLGEFLYDHDTTMSAPELADHLNRNEFKTNYGSEYKGERGTYTLIDNIVDDLTSKGQSKLGDKVARAFTKPDGTYAYNKK